MKNTGQVIVPKLRFPEFRNKPGWNETTIGGLGTFYYGKSAPKWSLEDNAPTACVRYGELYTKFGAIITETYSRTNIDPTNLRFSTGGEILIPRVGEKPDDFAKHCSYLTLKNIAIGEMISVFETKQNPLFYTYYFRNMYKQFAVVVEGQNVKNLYYNKLEPLRIFKPSLPEQQKIADCLCTLDELIYAENRMLETLKTHMQGLLQKLFPQPGQTQPRLRFPEFRNKGEWKQKCLVEVLSPIERKLKKPNEIYTGLGLRSHGKGTFLKNLSDPNKNSMEFLYEVKYNDLVVNITFAWEGAIAIAGIGDDGTLVSHRFPTYTFDKGNAIPEFFKYIIHDKQFIYNLGVISPGSGGRNRVLDKGAFLMLSVLLPNIEEQKSIAEFFITVDDQIKAQTEKIEILKLHKLGMMQQLFPAIEEQK